MALAPSTIIIGCVGAVWIPGATGSTYLLGDADVGAHDRSVRS